MPTGDIIGNIHIQQQRMGILQQSKSVNHWDAVSDATANYNLMPYGVGEFNPEPEVFSNQLPFYAAAGIMPAEVRSYIESASGLHKIPFSGINIEKNATFGILFHHLLAALQPEGTVTEEATTPFAKDIAPVDDVLDWDNNEGFLYTVATGGYDTGSIGDGVILQNALLNSFRMEWTNTNNGIDRLGKISGEWVGNVMTTEQHFTGTWVALPPSSTMVAYDSGAATVTLTIGDLDFANICYHRFAIIFNNNIESDCRTTGGKANGYKWTPEITFELELPYTKDAGTWNAFKDYMDGGNILLNFVIGNADLEGGLSVSQAISKFTANPHVIDGQYHGITLQGMFERPSSGWASGTFEMTDTIDAAV